MPQTDTAVFTDLLSSYLDSKAQERRQAERLAQREAEAAARAATPKEYRIGKKVYRETPDGGVELVHDFNEQEAPQESDVTVISKYLEGLAQTPGLGEQQIGDIGEILNRLEIAPDETPANLLTQDVNLAKRIVFPGEEGLVQVTHPDGSVTLERKAEGKKIKGSKKAAPQKSVANIRISPLLNQVKTSGFRNVYEVIDEKDLSSKRKAELVKRADEFRDERYKSIEQELLSQEEFQQLANEDPDLFQDQIYLQLQREGF